MRGRLAQGLQADRGLGPETDRGHLRKQRPLLSSRRIRSDRWNDPV